MSLDVNHCRRCGQEVELIPRQSGLTGGKVYLPYDPGGERHCFTCPSIPAPVELATDPFVAVQERAQRPEPAKPTHTPAPASKPATPSLEDELAALTAPGKVFKGLEVPE